MVKRLGMSKKVDIDTKESQSVNNCGEYNAREYQKIEHYECKSHYEK